MDKKDVWILALGIALFPPLWAVLSPLIGIGIGWIALATAALFVADGNHLGNALKIALGYLLGLLWGCLTLLITGMKIFKTANSGIVLYFTLFALGALAVLITHIGIKQLSYLPAWLCGWAISLGVLGGVGVGNWGMLPLEIAVSMIVGVYYVGVGIFGFQKLVGKLVHK